MDKRYEPVTFLGTGAFAETLIKRIVGQGVLPADKVIATVRRTERAAHLKRVYGIAVETDNLEAAGRARAVFLCVRPQDLKSLALPFRDFPFEDRLLISVIAGVPLKDLANLFQAKQIFRANPNPQIQVGCGYTAIASSSGTDEPSRNWVKAIFGSVGEVAFLDEPALDVVSVLSGVVHSLYVYDSFVEAGIHLGLPRQVAEKVAYHSMEGAMKLMEQGGKTSLELIREAATPGGASTEKLYVFEKHGLRGILIEAMRAAHEKVISFHVERGTPGGPLGHACTNVV